MTLPILYSNLSKIFSLSLNYVSDELLFVHKLRFQIYDEL